MRKLVFVLLFGLAASSFVLAAGPSYRDANGIGVTYLTFNQNYQTGVGNENAVISGLGMQGIFMTGYRFGLVATGTVGIAQSGSVDGSALDMSIYDTKLMFDFLFGLGFRQPIGPSADFLLGVGAHAGGALITSSGGTNYLDLAYAGGVGAVAKLSYYFTERMGVYLSATASYDPLPIVDGVSTHLQNGISYSGGAGIAFRR
ncbi:MAG TPA: hypothetical protein VMV68_00560 [Spirochaetia bacterium]|nr:hypothetical protein [Spirochaetia bacterium]